MDTFQFPPDPQRREQLEPEPARAALALLELTGSGGLCLPSLRRGWGRRLPGW